MKRRSRSRAKNPSLMLSRMPRVSWRALSASAPAPGPLSRNPILARGFLFRLPRHRSFTPVATALGYDCTQSFRDASQGHDDERDQVECPEGRKIAFVAHQQPAEVAQPGEGPLYLPTLRVARTSFCRTPRLGALPRAPLVRG